MNTSTSAINFAKNQINDAGKNDSGAFHPPKNSVTASPLTANIPKYSPMKNTAYLKPEYSVMNPPMISDSPSGRSNGDRFVSAIAATINNTNPARPQGVKTFHFGKIHSQASCRSTIAERDIVPEIITTDNEATTKGISKLI